VGRSNTGAGLSCSSTWNAVFFVKFELTNPVQFNFTCCRIGVWQIFSCKDLSLLPGVSFGDFVAAVAGLLFSMRLKTVTVRSLLPLPTSECSG
jgi:hypothetical protein